MIVHAELYGEPRARQDSQQHIDDVHPRCLRPGAEKSLCQPAYGYAGARSGYTVLPMNTIVGEIDFCACRCEVDAHDAYGCTSDGCPCAQTPSQLHAVTALRDSLSLFTPA